jgi:hypothetical protein
LTPSFGAVTRYGFDGIELQSELVAGVEIVGAVEVRLGDADPGRS